MGRDDFTQKFESIADYELLKMRDQDGFQNVQNGLVVLRRQPERYVVEYANPTLTGLLGQQVLFDPSGEGRSFLDAVYLFDITNVSKALRFTEQKGLHTDTYRLRAQNDQDLWFMGVHRFVQVEEEKYIFICFSNIQEFLGSQRQLKEENARWMDIINSVPVGLAVFSMENNKHLETVAVNDTLLDLANRLGKLLDGKERHWTRERMIWMLDHDLYSFSVEEDTYLIQDMLHNSIFENLSECDFRLRGSTKDNQIWVHCSCSSKLVSETKRMYYVSYADITLSMQNSMEIQKSHKLLSDMYYYDSMTGLLNRNAFNRFLETHKHYSYESAGISFVDVNGLKNANDVFGHAYGDGMIKELSNLLQENFRTGDIYRISGDEFVVFVPNIQMEEFNQRNKDLIKAIEKAGDIASVGYSWHENIAMLDEGIQKSEQLMYVEKQKYYAQRQDTISKHRPKMMKQFYDDVSSGRYKLYLQPKANIDSTKIIGAEALVRKFDEEGKIIFPDEFIPALEKEKLIPTLDYFMLEESCKLLRRWEKEGREPIKLSVNMSRITLAETDYMENILEICDKYKVKKDELEFEITESNETLNYQRLETYVAGLKEKGISVSLDDMGTDYSSLRMLLIAGIDTVKLDRSLILRGDSPQGRILIRHVINLSHDLGTTVIAEGVEDDDQRKLLENLGCDMYQGYYLSKPIPIEDFESLLDQDK
ncbi:MAG: bifunctional diguanylate cyclase/phosphodiesterase [Eubacterium sp.]|nr:bifunctional diguanylate cyclase/phosphodiesterase [Eubacterium sp.]